MIRQLGLSSGLLLGLFVAWELLVEVRNIPHYILPAPSSIIAVLVTQWPLFLHHAGITLLEVLLGAGLGLGTGFVVGLALFFFPLWGRAVYPLLLMTQNAPVFAIAPLLVVWFGYGIASKVVMATIIVFFPIALMTLQGLQQVDPDWIRLLQTMQASRLQLLWKVQLPAALPYIFGGIRLSVLYATIGAVLGEWVGAGSGLGYLMLASNAQLQIAKVFGAMFCLLPMGMGLIGLVRVLERLCLPWHYLQRNGAA